MATPGRPAWCAGGLWLLMLILLASPISHSATGISAGQPAADALMVERDLAAQLVRNARALLRSDPLTVRAIEAALILAQEAVELDESDPELWRFLLDIARLAERQELVIEAMDRLRQLDPHDDRLHYLKITHEVDEAQTVESRIARYVELLEQEEIPATVRSRLALSLAILERRRGRHEAFARWLSESVALDRAHAAAAALAAGYFRLHVDDPVGSGELLLNQFLANPVDISAQVLAANHCLTHGAYDAADRLYTFAVRSHDAIRLAPTPSDLIADLAIARWGAGKIEAAQKAITEYQHGQNIRHRERLMFEQPELSPLERAQHHAPISPLVAATLAAIRTRLGDELAPEDMRRVISAYQEQIDRQLEAASADDKAIDEATRAVVARIRLEMAWLSVWLSSTPEDAVDHLARAAELMDLSPRAADRINGWLAFRGGNAERAIELLGPHADDDAAAALGFAGALLDQGQRQSAARTLLQIVRAQPGTLIGVWASDQLAELLGRRVPITAEAARLETLVAELPPWIDRLPTSPTTVFSVRVRPVKQTFSPYEPIELKLEVVNHSSRPLGIHADGPIYPEVALLVAVQFSATVRPQALPPVIVGIDRRLRLESRESITIPIDLRQTDVGRMIDLFPLPGAMVRVRAVSNFYITPQGAVLPGLLGSEHAPPLFRIDGRRLTRTMLDEIVSGIIARPRRDNLREMAMIVPLLVGELERSSDPQSRRSIEQTLAAFSEAQNSLDPAARAWLLLSLPIRSAALQAFRDAARRSPERLVRLALMLVAELEPNDPILTAALRSDDARLRRLASILSDSREDLRALDEGPRIDEEALPETPPLNRGYSVDPN